MSLMGGRTGAQLGRSTLAPLVVASIAAAALAEGTTESGMVRGAGSSGGGKGPITTSQIATGQSTERAILKEEGSRYRYIVIRDSLHRRVKKLQRANRRTEILLYKDVGFVVNDPGCEFDPFQGSGVSFCQADLNEDWFLHDASGERLVSEGYPYLVAANIANPDYQQAWLDAVLGRLRDATGSGKVRYDGVFMDDTNLLPGHGLDGEISELTDAEYRQAAESFIDYVGPRLKQEGFTVIPNLALDSGNAEHRATALQLAEDVSAINREQFVRYGEDPALFTDPVSDSGSWISELTLMEEIQAIGAGYTAIVYGSRGDVQAQRYARATFLLGWSGGDGASLIYRTEGGDSYLPGWTTDVGRPRGARYAVGVGWRRDFRRGTVVVNPSPSSLQRFGLGRRYRVPGRGCERSVTLGPARGLTLSAC